MKFRAFFFAGLLSLSLGTLGGTGDPDAGRLRLAQASIGPDQAAAIARERTGGRVLGVQWGERGGAPVYLVRVLMPDGRVTVVPVHAGER